MMPGNAVPVFPEASFPEPMPRAPMPWKRVPLNGIRALRRLFHMCFSLLVGSGTESATIMEFEEMERLEEAGELRTAVQDRVRAWREAEREAGRAEGVELGVVELGVDRVRVLLRRMAERKFGAETAGRVAALLAGIGDPERLADAGEWIIDCGSGEELIARLERAA